MAKTLNKLLPAAGLLALGAGCAPKETVPTKQFQKRITEYNTLVEQKKQGLGTFDSSEYSDVQNYLLVKKQGPESVKKFVEQPKNQGLFTQNEPENNWDFYVAPQVGMKFALSAEDKPDPMTVIGLELGARQGRVGINAGIEHGELSEQANSDIARLKLESEQLVARIGVDYDLVDTGKFRLRVGAGPTLMRETNTITGRVLEYEVNESHTETTFGVEGNLRAEYDLTDNLSIGANANLRKHLGNDDSNVDLDGTLKLELKYKF